MTFAKSMTSGANRIFKVFKEVSVEAFLISNRVSKYNHRTGEMENTVVKKKVNLIMNINTQTEPHHVVKKYEGTGYLRNVSVDYDIKTDDVIECEGLRYIIRQVVLDPLNLVYILSLERDYD